MYTLRQKIRLWAIYSRSLILIIQFLVDFAVPDYQIIRGSNESLLSEIKKSGDKNFTFEWLHPLAHEDGEGDKVVDFLFGGLFKDEESQIFGHIAHRGYTYELTLTHFPLLPLVVRTIANALEWLTKDLCSVFHFASLVKVSCVGLNFVAFVVAADLLYSLSRRVLKDEYLAYKSVLLFCLTPTAVFFSGGHIEACLAASTFAAMLILERSGLGMTSGILLAICTSIHASGLLHLGLVLHRSMKQVATSTILYVREKKKILTSKTSKEKTEKKDKNDSTDKTSGLWTVFNQIAIGAFIPGVWNLVLCLFPFAAYQWFAYAAFCRLNLTDVDLSEEVTKYGKEHGLKMPGYPDKPDWCKNDPPVSYFSVHSMNWPSADENSTKGIDILIYSTIGQLPYLISSAPTLALIFWQCFVFLKVHRRFCFRLGLVDNTYLGMAKPRAAPVTRTRALPRECLVYLFHALTLAFAGLFTLPIQISNRLILCSSPVLYWIGAMVTTPSERELVPTAGTDDNSRESESEAALKVETTPNLKNLHSTILLLEGPSDDLGNSTKIFFLGYCVIGTIFHVNCFPWT